MQNTKITFPRPTPADFYNTARKRVNEYFKNNNIKIHANTQMVLKTIAMMLIYLIPYLLLVLGIVTNPYVMYGLWIVMGFGMAGIGLSVMHDANHGAYSKNKNVNTVIAQVIWLIGGSSTNWRIQHNVLHHSYTNIDHMDEDLNTVSFLRFSPHDEWRKIHRYQYLYAWFFYGLMTIMWATVKDFNQLTRYKQKDLIKTQKKSFTRLVLELLFIKAVYYVFILIIPLMTIAAPWYVIVLSFLSMHFVAGLSLALIFQPAHISPRTEFPLPDDQGNMENKWAIHQLLTTTNYAPKAKFFSWYVGGLNFQIEHHLFPNICHIHYKKISKIVKETAQEFNLPYYSERTFLDAVSEHTRFLKELGKA